MQADTYEASQEVETMAIPADDIRASSAILTLREVAGVIDMKKPERIRAWTKKSGSRPPMVHSVPAMKRGYPTIPLVGLAESSSLHALRAAGMSMQEAARTVTFIREEYDDPFALANPKFVTDGTDAFVQSGETIIRVRDKQAAFHDVLKKHLRPLLLGDDGYVERYRLFKDPEIIIDPRFNSGRPSFADTMVPVFPIAGALEAGEPVPSVAGDFGLSFEQVRFVEQHKERLALIA